MTQAMRAVSEGELLSALQVACQLAEDRVPVVEAAGRLGTTGYVVHTLAFAVYCFSSGDQAPLACIQRAIAGGGDTDTIAAIVGAWAGALDGSSALPAPLLQELQDGPFGPTHLRALAHALASGGPPPNWSWPRALLRNLLLYPIVIAHGFRRLMPF